MTSRIPTEKQQKAMQANWRLFQLQGAVATLQFYGFHKQAHEISIALADEAARRTVRTDSPLQDRSQE